jgi:hypothetical protein
MVICEPREVGGYLDFGNGHRITCIVSREVLPKLIIMLQYLIRHVGSGSSYILLRDDVLSI